MNQQWNMSTIKRYINLYIFNHLILCLAAATHNFKLLKIIYIYTIKSLETAKAS